MRLLPAQEALDFAAGVAELLGRVCGSEKLRAAWDSGDGRVPGLWKRLADLGVLGLTLSEDHGGAGMDLTALVPVLVEIGRAAAPEPVVETLAVATSLAGAPAEEWLPRIAAGDVVAAMGEGTPAVLAGGRWADVFVITDEAGVRLLRRDEVEVAEQATIDPGVGVASVSATGEGVELDGTDPVAAFDFACVAVAAELVGLAQAMLETTVSYAQQREQFGRPIGSFQAVKHQLADVYVGNAFALPVVHRAAWSVAHDLPSRSRDASHAKLAASRAAERAARTALQVHGAIGYTYEHDLHIWMKRAWSLTSLWGGPAFHRGRVAADLLGGRPTPRVP